LGQGSLELAPFRRSAVHAGQQMLLLREHQAAPASAASSPLAIILLMACSCRADCVLLACSVLCRALSLLMACTSSNCASRQYTNACETSAKGA
jgi:hypothetical protein